MVDPGLQPTYDPSTLDNADESTSNINQTPLWAPEPEDNPFIPSEGRVPLTTVLGKEFQRGATSGFDLVSNLALRANAYYGFADIEHDPFLTSSQYEASPWKIPGVSQSKGLHESLANEMWNHWNREQIFGDLNARTDKGTWASLAKGGAYLAGNAVDPLFYLLGGAAESTGAADALSHLIPIARDVAPETQAFIRGLTQASIRGGVDFPVFNAMSYAEAKVNEEDASAWSILYGIPEGMGIGAGFFFLGRILKAAIPKLNSKFAKSSGIDEPPKDSTEETYQPYSQKNHEEMLKTAVSQLENGKNVDVKELAKEGYSQQWSEQNKDSLSVNFEVYERSLENIKTNRLVSESRLKQVNEEIERLRDIGEPHDSDEMHALHFDKSALEESMAQQDAIIEMKGNVPEQSNIEDIKNSIEDMNSSVSDRTNIKEDADSANDSRTNELLARNRLKQIENELKELKETDEPSDSEKIKSLRADIKDLKNRISEHESIAKSREDVTDRPDMTDVHNALRPTEEDLLDRYGKKDIERPESIPPEEWMEKPPVPIKLFDKDKAVNQYHDEMSNKFEQQKENMSKETKDIADSEDIKDDVSDRKTFIDALKDCYEG